MNKIHASSPDGTTLLQVAKGIYARGGWPRFWHAWQPVSCVVATEKFVSADLRVCVGAPGLWPLLRARACGCRGQGMFGFYSILLGLYVSVFGTAPPPSRSHRHVARGV